MEAPCLPQHDPDPEARQAANAEATHACSVRYDRFEGIAMAETVGPQDHASDVWLGKVATVLVELGINAAAVDQRLSVLHPDHPEHRSVLSLIRDAERGGMRHAFETLQGLTQGSADTDIARTLPAYEALFQTLPLPPSAAECRDDLWFARMRVAGPNPMSLAAVDRLPEHVALTEAEAARAMGVFADRGIDTAGGTLAAALAEGRLFVADYAVLDGAPEGSWKGRRKHLYAPTALFMTVGMARTLVPVAIQPTQKRDGPALTPADGESWQVAKSMAMVADGNLHQSVIHLAHTHLVMEAVVLASRRHLAPRHPVARLLAQHFEGTLYINDAAETKLAAPGGGVDAVMGGPITFSRAAAVNGVTTWSFLGSRLENDLASRGVADSDTLPDYPFRDDARLLNAAIRRFVEGVLRTYYATDADVHGDVEVAAMFAWLGAAEGGRIAGVRAPATVSDLVEAVTHIVFTVSAQHAAVNFPQLPVMSFAAAYPLAGYRPYTRGTATAADWLAMLPPLDQAHYQATLGTLLGSVHHTVLGQYHNGLLHNFMGDARIKPAMHAFSAELVAAEGLVAQRNRARVPYTVLLPSRVPQSINI